MALESFIRYIKQKFKLYIFFLCTKELIRTSLSIFFSILLSEITKKALLKDLHSVLYLSFVILAVEVFEFAFFCSCDYFLQINASKNEHLCKLELYRCFFEKPLHELKEINIGETKEKLTEDFEILIKRYSNSIPSFIVALISAFIYFVYLISLSKWIALVFFIIAFLQIVPPIIIQKYLQANYDNCRDIESKITNYVVSANKGMLLIKLYNLNNWWEKKLAEYHKKYIKIGRKSIYTGTAESFLNNIVDITMTYVSYGIVGLFVLDGLVSLDVGVQAIAISASVFSLVKSVFELIKDNAINKSVLNRLATSLEKKSFLNSQIFEGNVIIRNISFSYNNNIIFSNLSFKINNSKITIIKGKNGCGKTTLLNLIMGLEKELTGEISIDGFSPFELAPSNYPNKIFYLTQEDPVWDLTAIELFEMILSYKMNVAVEIAVKFGLNETLLRSSKISNVSGGERKKIFLSIGFVLDPLLMVLDEPTNSLDIKGKALLHELLCSRNGRTIIVTHDAFADDIANNIFSLEE